MAEIRGMEQPPRNWRGTEDGLRQVSDYLVRLVGELAHQLHHIGPENLNQEEMQRWAMETAGRVDQSEEIHTILIRLSQLEASVEELEEQMAQP